MAPKRSTSNTNAKKTKGGANARGRLSLPVLQLPAREQRYACHGSGRCCRDFTVQLRDDDVAKLDAQGWARRLGESPYLEFRGNRWLRQRDDGACIFLMDDGKCRVHAEHGFENKPLACQMFPFTLMPTPNGVQVGLSFACPSVINNLGEDLASHFADVKRFARSLPELHPEADARPSPIAVRGDVDAEPGEAEALARTLDEWMQRVDLPIETRLDGGAWLTAMLREADLTKVRGDRFRELLDALVTVMPDEIAAAPPTGPTKRQRKLIRQVAYAHAEDPKIGAIAERGVRGTALKQLMNNHRFGRGRGSVPIDLGPEWPDDLSFDGVDDIRPASDPDEIRWIDFLMLRYVRARVLGGRAWGAGYYGWPCVEGLEAMWAMLAATGWLARLHARAHHRDELRREDVQAALLRTDRNAGRAPWLGSQAERLRHKYLSMEQGIRRLRHAYRLAEEPDTDDAFDDEDHLDDDVGGAADSTITIVDVGEDDEPDDGDDARSRNGNRPPDLPG
ncbi:MAG: YkgJ family cysteine cluster protein [Planctomycetota bacterium]